MRRLALCAAATALTLALAAPAGAATLRGTVVHRNAHRLVVATASGRMVAIRTSRHVRVGSLVRVSGSRIRTIGRTRHARLRGTVTYVNRRSGVFTLSARGASVLIHSRRLGRRARAADVSMPAPGSNAAVDSDIQDNGDLDAQDVQQEGQDNNGIDLEGTILAVDTTARTLSISADDDEQSGAALVVHVPDSFDISQFQTGDDVELVVTRESDGSFTLQKVDGNEGDDQGDNNNGDDGGNDHGDHGDNGDNGGNGGGGGDG